MAATTRPRPAAVPNSDRSEPASAAWPVWSTTAQVVVTDPDRLDAARRLVADQLAAVDAVASRFRADAEIVQLDAADGTPQQVSPLLAELIGVALAAARQTGGAVDPTLGGPLADLGYDRDIAQLAAGGPPVRVVRRPAPGWQRVRLTGRLLTLPADVQLDLGATAKAHTADRCAALVADRLGTGVLVSLGGDIATAGPPPPGGWRVRVLDQPGEPACTVGLPPGTALATSSTLGRRWRRGHQLLHHVLDPRTCQPAPAVWRTVTVAAASCLAANTASTAAIVRGPAAPDALRREGLAARLVDADGTVVTVAGWPSPTQRSAPAAVAPEAVAPEAEQAVRSAVAPGMEETVERDSTEARSGMPGPRDAGATR
ncbi:membrane-associated lipoprotein involved in thiamine biosynthesis [Frankia torreyi]|uniref:FAD:protein FMN transferase n=1 Tax=Frankia torreyi TaxID=1856 RepID=A0A0D8BFN2_9ACTN|nr:MULTISPECIES: FAD:protein FMN transferase [Frankia]KJE22769.1 membrane-associated lipoprotein involved in thiamine biosynthesis [Frankia torreyi]KQM04718.1 membrane-associated lipoprotein involved in thiamine biosynthesis [Frankia sp. CpI1-P]